MSKGRLKNILSVVVILAAGGYFFDDLTSSGYLSRLEESFITLDRHPPVVGTDGHERDEEFFRQTRALQGTARWELARKDANENFDYILKRFSAVLPITLTPQNVPALVKFEMHVEADVDRLVGKAKNVFDRPRPFQYLDGPICTDKAPKSYDYPSGHSTRIFTVGFILIKLFPEYKNDILAVANDYAYSRVVCGVHSISAVEAAQKYARDIFKRLVEEEDYQADFIKARQEIEILKMNAEE